MVFSSGRPVLHSSSHSVSAGISRDLGVLQFFLPVLFIYCHCTRFIASGVLRIFLPSGFSTYCGLLNLQKGFVIFVFISCSSSPAHKVMKVGCWSPLSHSQALAKEIWRQFPTPASIKCSAALSLSPASFPPLPGVSGVLRITLHPSSPSPKHQAMRVLGNSCLLFSSLTSWVFLWKQHNVFAFLLVLTWGLRWDQHLSSCELSPAKTLGILFLCVCGVVFIASST